MNIALTFFRELQLLLRVQIPELEQTKEVQFYIHRFQSKALMISNLLTFFMYAAFLPYIIYSFNHYSYHISRQFYTVIMVVSFLGLFVLAYEFHQRFHQKKFDKGFKILLIINIVLIIIINYFSAYILNQNNLNFYLMVFSIAYINVCMVLNTVNRVLYTISNSIFLILCYLYFKPEIQEKELFQVLLIVLLNVFFMIIGQIFYKLFLITIKKHLEQKRNLNQINEQKNLIEEILKKQQESIKKLQLSLNLKSDVKEIIENPLILSQKINNLIYELNDAKDSLQQSKEKYKDIFDNVSDGIMIRNKDFEITICNPKVEELTGFNMNADNVNSLDALIKSSFKESYSEYLNELKNCKEAEFTGEITTNRQIGNTWIEIFSTPILKDGKFNGSRDIIRKVTKEQQRMIKSYENYEAERLFLLNLNHEIRTPLNSIVGLTHLLKSSDLPDAEKEMIELLNHSSLYLKDLVSDILELTNLETGNYQIQEKLHPFYQENLKIIQNFQYLAKEKGIDLQFNCPISLNENFKFDLVLYTKILNNLISNAFKFTDKGFVRLEVLPELREYGDQTFVEIQVEDTGTGIEKEYQANVFDKFKQFNMNQPKSNQGIGLGLSICKEIITQLKGKITLTSELGKGSTFSFLFPITQISTYKIVQNENIQNAYRRG